MQKSHIVYLVLIICLLPAIWFLLNTHDISVDTILAFAPEHPVQAAAVVLLLYAIKSATVVLPLIVLEIAVGHLFPLWAALGLNFIGLLIVLTIPYLMGRAAGMNAVRKLTQKYPRFGEVIGVQQNNALFLCFFLRIISCLPGDIVSMYMGATHMDFWKNLLGGALGTLPGMILATIMGSSIQDPGSPAFWISAILTVAMSVLSFILYHIYRRKTQKKNRTGTDSTVSAD